MNKHDAERPCMSKSPIQQHIAPVSRMLDRSPEIIHDGPYDHLNADLAPKTDGTRNRRK